MEKDINLHVVFVSAWIRKGNKFLMSQRSSKDKQAPGIWALPGGKMDLEIGNDTIENTLRKEIREEVGLEIEEEIKYLSSESFIRSNGHHVVSPIFLVNYKSGKAKALEDQDAVKWMSLNEIDKVIKTQNSTYFLPSLLKLKQLLFNEDKNNIDALKETKNTYEEIAEEYKRIRSDVSKTRPNLDKFISLLKGKNVLDVGCGPGRDTKYFIENGFNATGIDYSKKFVEICKKDVPKVTFKIMDMCNITFADRSFDGLWVSASFLHIPKPNSEKVLRDFHRVLKNNGILYLSVIGGTEEVLFEDIKNHPGYLRFFARYTKEELVNIIRKAGFEVIEVVETESHNNKINFINIFAKKT
jgi:ubiquinone/menaquinone biosynthesis C-methylase UbiE/ADP-ribose pyrophosphatase YjhB (NUDIX family)